MDQTSQEDQAVLYTDFLNNLEDDKSFHQKTNQANHRFRMASMALTVAKDSVAQLEVSDFINVSTAVRQAVFKQFQQIQQVDAEILEDILETLRVVARHTQLQATRKEKATAYVESVLKNSKKSILK
jgi:hypothetical protein